MRDIAGVMLILAVCGCGNEAQVSQPLAADARAAAASSYQVVKVAASLGGTQSRGMAINTEGLVAGWSNRADGSRHAVIWRNGAITDLLTLGGPSSTVPWPGSTTPAWSSACRIPPGPIRCMRTGAATSAGFCRRPPISSAAASSGRTG